MQMYSKEDLMNMKNFGGEDGDDDEDDDEEADFSKNLVLTLYPIKVLILNIFVH